VVPICVASFVKAIEKLGEKRENAMISSGIVSDKSFEVTFVTGKHVSSEKTVLNPEIRFWFLECFNQVLTGVIRMRERLSSEKSSVLIHQSHVVELFSNQDHVSDE
jgi:hypothetical protein